MSKSKYPLGKIKCEILRELRVKFAQQNNIEFHPAECHHQGDCKGTCPACDAELLYLNEMSERLGNKGLNITYN